MEYKLANGMVFYTDKNLAGYTYLAADSDGEVYAYVDKPILEYCEGNKEYCEVNKEYIWDVEDGISWNVLSLGFVPDTKGYKDLTEEETVASLTEL